MLFWTFAGLSDTLDDVLYFKLALVTLWLIFSSAVGLIYSIFRLGSYNTGHDYAQAFSWVVLKLLGIEVEIEGREHLEAHQPCIYIANHQSGLDMATLGPVYPHRTILIGKKEILWIPLFGLFYVSAGNIIIDRKKSVKAVAGLQNAVKKIQSKKLSVWIFPEGTRNRTGVGLLPFKRGAFHMAIQAGIPLVPIVSGPLKEIADWKSKTLKKGRLKIKVLPPIEVEGLTVDDVERLAKLAHAKMSEAFQLLGSPGFKS